MENPRINTNGMRMYKKILAKDSGEDLRGIREFTLNHLYGTIWARDVLSIRDRRLITLALLAAQGFSDQLGSHLDGAINGDEKLSEDELFEIMIHVGHYASWAAGTNGHKMVQKCFLGKG